MQSLKLVAFDCDGVLADTHSSWEFVHNHFGLNNDESYRAYMRGEIDDHEFMRRDISLWWRNRPDIRVADIERIFDGLRPMKGASEVVAELHRRGIRTVVVSSGLDILVNRIAREVGVATVFANGVESYPDGTLTGNGTLQVPLRDKSLPLGEHMRRLGIRPEEAAAVGNSESDAAMFRVASCGIAFNPTDEVIRRAALHTVIADDLRAILPHLLDPGKPY